MNTDLPIPAPLTFRFGNGRVGGEGAQFDRAAANEGAPESSSAVNAICALIRQQTLWPEDVVALLNAISGTVADGANAHLKLHEDIVTSIDELSDSISAVVSGEAEGL